ncbi:MAG: DoxX family protein [Caldilineaceae bacterium]|nr:DoxX family protein [Caldilineaceae bacterium]
MNNTTSAQSWGLLILRLVVGLIFAVHGAQKFFMFGLDGTAGFLGSLGIPLPQIAAIVLILIELVGGVALLLGLGTRYVAALLAVDMVVALLTVHLPNGFFVDGGGVEFVLLLLASALFFALNGAGSLSLDKRLFQRA